MKTPWHRRLWFAPAAVFAAALAYRIVYFLASRGDPLMTFVDAVPDAALFHNWAIGILEGTPFKGAYYIGPAYAWFLAGIYRVFGVHLYAVIIVQLVLDAATGAMVYLMARRLFGAAAAAVAGAIWILYLPAAFFATWVLPTTLTIALAAAALYLLMVAAAEGKTRRRIVAALAAGALFGGASLARPNLLVFVPALALWPFISGKRLWRPVLLFALPVIMLVAAVTLRNKIAADDWVLISSQGGVNFYIGNHEGAPGSFQPIAGSRGRPEEMNAADPETAAPPKASASSRRWFARGLGFLGRRPAEAALLYGRKLSLLTNSYETTLNVDFNFRGEFSPFHRIPVPYYGVLLALGITGLGLGRLRGTPGIYLLLIYVAAVAASILLFFVVDSYRLPLAPALAAAAGGAAAILAEDWRRRRWGPAAAGTAAVGLLLAFAWLPGAGVDRDAIATQSYVNFGAYYFMEGDLDRAGRCFNRALAYKRDNVDALFYLAQVYERRGRDDLARRYYLDALDYQPTDPEINYYLGANLARAGAYSAAIIPLKTAVETLPRYDDAWLLLANCYRAMGDHARAAEAYRRSGLRWDSTPNP